MGLEIDTSNSITQIKYEKQTATNSSSDNPISVFSFDNLKKHQEEFAIAGGIAAMGLFGLSLLTKKRLPSAIFQRVSDNGFEYTKLFNTSRKYKVALSKDTWQRMIIKDNRMVTMNIKNPHPENLYDELKRCEYSISDLNILLQNNPKLSRLIGSFPICGNKICQQETTVKVDQILSKYAKQFHHSNSTPANFENKLAQELSEIIGKQVNIKYIGYGKFGTVYKINVNGNDYAYKMYHNELLANQTSILHGNNAELLNGIRANKDNTGYFTKLYMGRFSENNDGYLLTQFVEGVKEKEDFAIVIRQKFKDYTRTMDIRDLSPQNLKNGIVIDFGNLIVTPFGKMSKEAQSITQKVFDMLDNNSVGELKAFVTENKNKNEFKEMINYIEYLKEDFFISYTSMFAEKKELFKILNIDYKPNIKSIIDKYKTNISQHFEQQLDYLKHYGLTESQWHKLINDYINC